MRKFWQNAYIWYNIFGDIVKNRFKELRNERNLTLRELAEFIDINYSTIACYETDKREPNIETLKKLTSFFEVSLDYICGDDKYIYILYENANQKLSITKQTYDSLKEYIYFNKDNNRCIDINKYLNVNNNSNIFDFIKEISVISNLEVLFDNKSYSVNEFNNIINQDVIMNKELLDKVKEIIK